MMVLSCTALHERALRRTVARRAVQASDALLRTLYIGTALLGLLVTPPVVTLLLAPGLAATAVVLLAGFVWYLQQSWSPRHTLTAAATAALIPFGQAVQALQTVGTAISLAVLALLTVVGLGQIAQPSPRTAPGAGHGIGDDASPRGLLQVVPLETLLEEWRVLDDLPDEQRSSRAAAAAAEARTLLLDELQRRDPEGFSAWLASGAAGPPDEHLRGDRGQGA